MPSVLKMSALLENYIYSKKISEEELNLLEQCWLHSLNAFHYKKFPNFAPAVVCDAAGVSQGSYWIVCNAAILDLLRPIEIGRSRKSRILGVLREAGVCLAA